MLPSSWLKCPTIICCRVQSVTLIWALAICDRLISAVATCTHDFVKSCVWWLVSFESLVESRDSFWSGGVADLATRIFRRPPHSAMLAPSNALMLVGHFNANGASLDFGSSKDPSGRNMVIIQSFAFETIFLHPGGNGPRYMCTCVWANTVGKLSLTNAFGKCLQQSGRTN